MYVDWRSRNMSRPTHSLLNTQWLLSSFVHILRTSLSKHGMLCISKSSNIVTIIPETVWHSCHKSQHHCNNCLLIHICTQSKGVSIKTRHLTYDYTSAIVDRFSKFYRQICKKCTYYKYFHHSRSPLQHLNFDYSKLPLNFNSFSQNKYY